MKRALLPCILLLAACAQPQQHSEKQLAGLHELEWMEGTWKAVSDGGAFIESWHRVNDSTFEGHGNMIVKGDTVFAELLLLKQQGNDIFYIPSVSDQNNAQPVSFRLISTDSGRFVFENAAHDFPQRIVYTHPADDSLHAWIEGTENGRFNRQDFRMAR